MTCEIQANLITVGIAASRFAPEPGLVDWPMVKNNASLRERCYAGIQVIAFEVDDNTRPDNLRFFD